MTGAGGILGVPATGRRLVQRGVPRNTRVQSGPPAVPRVHRAVAWIALLGIVLPQQFQISLGPGVTFTPGRISAALLFVPALLALFQNGRRLVLCDFLATATAGWMIVAAVGSVGPSAIPAAGGDALDFLGGYLVSRAYFLGRPALDAFVQVLKLLTIIVIILAVADSISGKNVLPHETIALAEAVLRDGWARASSTFDHPILFGVFCAVTAAILLYWEKTFLGRSGAAGLCLLGCFLSLSSAALMASAIILIVFAYDQLFGRYSWRWSAFWVTLGASMLAVLVVTEHPLNWIFSHLTFNPQTGYYRAMVWDVALTYIAQSPVIGYGYEFNDVLLDNTVDSIWLVLSLRFGVPMLLLFFLTNVAAFFSNPRSLEGAGDVHMDRMRLAFTLVLLMFMFTGLTVHFWKSMLTFWGVCLGVRASLRESAIHGIG
ncbi:O-antigen ligase family protein [Bradyrhizobium sp. Rc2d]|uniref:O-antigen ligase family protein n=1 Tax=Bradyrhizobium sp. Rc2d TaxID=1855321 RepID=UPI00115F919C|nr:O-antigen ligase family protein [Bradyrhizobium sp. Rc2d]